MASVAVAPPRNQYHGGRKKINCRAFHSFHPKSPPKSSNFLSSPRKGSTFSEDFSCSELWAGPAYINSPPPSSLPLPKFSLRQKRSVSLELPPLDSRALTLPGSRSAPVSPKSESMSSSSSNSLVNTAFATENLRRILNLDVGN